MKLNWDSRNSKRSWHSVVSAGLIPFCLIEVGLFFSWPWGAIILPATIIVVFAVSCWRSQQAKRLHPKDFAFSVYAEWGLEKRIPRKERLKEVFPHRSEEEIEKWISEFKEVDVCIGRIAALGGSHILGDKVVIEKLQATFPFLKARGLRQAKFLVRYYAWHEGHHLNPQKD